MTAADAARVVVERDRILQDPEFRHVPGIFDRWVLPFMQSIVAWFEQLSPWAYATIIVLLVLALVALLAHLFVSLTRQAQGVTSSAAARPAAAGASGPRAAALPAQARQALAAGRFAEAVRLAWLAALAALDAAGVSPAQAGRADWEHVADVRRRRGEAAAGDVAALASAFQRTRFGGAAVDASAAAGCLDALGALEGRLGADGR